MMLIEFLLIFIGCLLSGILGAMWGVRVRHQFVRKLIVEEIDRYINNYNDWHLEDDN